MQLFFYKCIRNSIVITYIVSNFESARYMIINPAISMAGNSTSPKHLLHHVATSLIHLLAKEPHPRPLVFRRGSSFSPSRVHLLPVSFSSSSGALVKVSLFERRHVLVRFVSRRLLEGFWLFWVPIERLTVRFTIPPSLLPSPCSEPLLRDALFSRRYKYGERFLATIRNSRQFI